MTIFLKRINLSEQKRILCYSWGRLPGYWDPCCRPAKSVKKLKEEGIIRRETDQGDKREEALSCGKTQESPPGDGTNRFPAE